MKIDSNKKVRKVAGENIIIMSDGGAADMTRVVALNESALELYNALKDCDFELDDAVRVLTETYEVDSATARRDAEEWIASMKQNNILIP